MAVDNRCEACKAAPKVGPGRVKAGACVRCDATICVHTADKNGITSYGNGYCVGVAGCEHRQNVKS